METYTQMQNSDMTAYLQNLIDAAEEGSTLTLPTGTVYISAPLKVTGKKNLKISGYGTDFLHTGFDATSRKHQPNTALFILENCQDVTLAGFTVDYQDFVSIAGTVVETDAGENPYFVLRLFPEFTSVTGKEYYAAALSFDPDGAPNYHLAGNADFQVEKIADDLLKVYYPNPHQVARLSLGELMNIRFCLNGAPVISNLASDGTLFEDITVYQAVSCSFYIGMRSGSVSFEGLKIIFKEGTKRLMTSNVDAIHIKGMTGKLTLHNCVFDGLGDDAVNVHSRAGILTEADFAAGTVRFVDGWSKQPTDSTWAFTGDTVEFYDPKTFLAKGTATVRTYADGRLLLDKIPEGATEGDILANLAYLPAVHIDGCTVTRNRARAFLMQTRNVIIENCTLNRISLPAIIVAPDIQRWFEVGPSRNVIIRNNKIEKCAFFDDGANLGAIVVKASHDHGYAAYPAGVHRDIVIENNEIDETAHSAIFVSATEGLTVRGNRIGKFGTANTLPTDGEAINTVNCTNTVIENNTTLE